MSCKPGTKCTYDGIAADCVKLEDAEEHAVEPKNKSVDCPPWVASLIRSCKPGTKCMYDGIAAECVKLDDAGDLKTCSRKCNDGFKCELTGDGEEICVDWTCGSDENCPDNKECTPNDEGTDVCRDPCRMQTRPCYATAHKGFLSGHGWWGVKEI